MRQGKGTRSPAGAFREAACPPKPSAKAGSYSRTLIPETTECQTSSGEDGSEEEHRAHEGEEHEHEKETDAGGKGHDGDGFSAGELPRPLDDEDRDHREVDERERHEERTEQRNRLHPEDRRRDPEGPVQVEELAGSAEDAREHTQK